MRHLILWRRPENEEAALGLAMVRALQANGVDAVSEVCQSWMPARLDGDAEALTQRLDWLCRGFGVVHAVGGRVVAACAAAFGMNRPWVATTLDHQKLVTGFLVQAPAVCFPASSGGLRHALGRTLLPPWEATPPPERTLIANDSDLRLVGLLTEGLSGDTVYAMRQAVRRVQRTLPHVRIALHGPGTAAMEDSETLGAGEALSALDFMGNCHTMLFPYEPGPLRLDVLRAIALGLPVFIEEQHPAQRWVHDGRNGAHFNLETLSDLLMSVMRDDYTREGMAHESRRLLSEEHDPLQQGKALLGLYEDVMDATS